MSYFVELRKHFPARSLEWFEGCILLTWGLYVILHPGMFSNPESSKMFSGLNAIAPQEQWGLLALSAASIRLLALYINGQWTRTPIIRVVVSFISIFVWFCISVGLYRSGVQQTGIIIYPWLMLGDMYSAYRAASDAYEAEAQRRLKKLMETSNVASLNRG